MANIPDMSKIAGNFDLKKIIQNVKSVISAEPPLSEAAKANPIAHRLSEITKSLRTLEEMAALQKKEIETIGAHLGSLYKELGEHPITRKTVVEHTETINPPETIETKSEEK